MFVIIFISDIKWPESPLLVGAVASSAGLHIIIFIGHACASHAFNMNKAHASLSDFFVQAFLSLYVIAAGCMGI